MFPKMNAANFILPSILLLVLLQNLYKYLLTVEVSCEIFMIIDSSDGSFFAVFFHESYTIPLSDTSNIFSLSTPTEREIHPLEIQSKT